MPNQMSDPKILERAVNGDSAAFEELLLVHCPFLSRHIARRIPASLQSVISVEDVLQHTLLQAFKNINRFKPKTSGSFSVWLRTIAENQLNNTVASMTRQKRGGGGKYRQVDAGGTYRQDSLIGFLELISSDGRTPSQSAMRREAVDVIQVAIARLPEDQRAAVEWRCLQGKSLDETAERMGKTANAVRGLIYRATEAIKGSLGSSSRWFLDSN